MVIDVADWLIALLLIIGAATMLIASIGLIRMPDLFLRMSGVSKASTLGVGSMALAAAFAFAEVGVTARAVAIVAFALFSTPIAAHMMSRAAYGAATPLWERTVVDEIAAQPVQRSSSDG